MNFPEQTVSICKDSQINKKRDEQGKRNSVASYLEMQETSIQM